MEKQLIAKATIQIQKPVSDVFDAIVDSNKITQYFIGSSTGRIEPDAKLMWTFPEFDEICPIAIITARTNQLIEFAWDPETIVRIAFHAQQDNSTVVRVEEGKKVPSNENLVWLMDNTAGWANFLACLKAFLEYGINLRKGAFDFIKNEKT